MKKFFNTAGANQPRLHYTVWREDGVRPILELIEQEKYFTHHAPRQSGKTTLLRELCKKLNAEGRYLAIHISVEDAQSARHDVIEANHCVLRALNTGILFDESLASSLPKIEQFFDQSNGVRSCLEGWSRVSKKPIVLIIDEIDTMAGESLIALLRQLRAGYD
ncbi:MAG: AAA family ATPase, partial [Candidatus Cloacimonetes bacterium]|nr:AAA family ATPase [Candidatus Cloacimonadota bacterium]